jgi:RNA polymerase sigma-70 factor (ECF subfamily)
MPFRLWLRQVAHDRIIMAHRRHLGASRRAVSQERAMHEASSVALAERLIADGPSVSERLAREERARRVRSAVSQLKEADREIILMRTFESLSFDEIAALLHVDPAAARKRHGRALLRLSQLLSGDDLTGASNV